jgi:hypothetical protein
MAESWKEKREEGRKKSVSNGNDAGKVLLECTDSCAATHTELDGMQCS